MGKNLLIPIPLVRRIIELLGYWDVSGHDRVIRDEYRDILKFLDVKLRKLDLRDAYAKVINSANEDIRDDARIDYLWQKSLLKDFCRDDHPT